MTIDNVMKIILSSRYSAISGMVSPVDGIISAITIK